MSNRPVILIGNGVRNNPKLVHWLCQLRIPVLVTWQAIDMIAENNHVFCGRLGVVGQRAANMIIQKCDWLLVVGARLDMETVGHNLPNFAPRAHKIVVDEDLAELNKFPVGWELIIGDLSKPMEIPTTPGNKEWLAECRALYEKFHFELEGSDNNDEFVNPYSFIHALSLVCDEGEVIVAGSSGMQSCALMQAFEVKEKQRILCCNTLGAMGMEAMAIGASIASKRRVIVVTGDGGFSLNIQELEVVKRLDLPIHYFVFSNDGYGSICVMQDGRFGLRVGSTEESGLTLPDWKKVASVWSIPYTEFNGNEDLWQIRNVLLSKKATLTRVKTSLDFRYACRVASNMKDGVLVPDDMSDMTPKIAPEELKRIMQ